MDGWHSDRTKSNGGNQKTPVGALKTNPMGRAIGPMREAVNTLSLKEPSASKIVVMEGDTAVDAAKAVLVSAS